MKVVITKTALRRFHQLTDYLLEEWGESSVIQFEKRTASFLDLLAEFPEIGTEVNASKKIRAFQLTKQTRVFYRIKADQILILTFFDVRQDPDSLKY
ncbi:type II toxin-antitoxin system RelE/ParE family toxin [uncultured Algoriphagus sp.]|uniref:type II toxin-antitoxin system RelE/ParE family toxin n=1 Tax=uncultured Algoriphagus sp. TaxID=417365 RepID=UPI00258304C9|nr:type II toxin-antitoxin system RelE/ParE family toxin [uncultured Algoriphagus sp.]